MTVKDIDPETLTKLTEYARKAFAAPEIELTNEYFDAVRGPFGKSLREVLNDPSQGVGEVMWYMDFKAAGGFE